MPRLRYSANGLVRALSMTRVNCTTFVEGMLDRFFFGEIMNRVPALNGKSVEIRLAQELDPSLGSGKKALLSLFRMLRRRKKLRQDDVGLTKVVVFVLDKDVDEIRRCKSRSPHVFYTEHYSVENYLYRHGNLALAARSAASLDPQSTVGFPTNAIWSLKVAQCWAEWIAFCLMNVRLNTPGVPNYGVKSLFHTGPYTAIDVARKNALLGTVATRTGLPVASIHSLFANALGRFNITIQGGSFDRFFNGKWYGCFLVADTQRLAAGRQIQGELEPRLTAALGASLDFEAGWAITLQDQLSNFLHRIMM